MRLSPLIIVTLIVSLATPALAAPAFKDQLGNIKQLRKSGKLQEAASALVESPRPQGLVERFRLWRAQKGVVRAARKAMKAKSLEAHPDEGKAALKILAAEGKLSLLDKARAGIAMVKGGKHAFRNAQKLADRGRALEAIAMFEFGKENGEIDLFKEAKLRIRLHNAAMAQAKEIGEVYATMPEGPMKEQIFDRAIKLLEAANQVGTSRQMDLSGAVPGRLRRIVGGKVVSTEKVIESMGLTGEEISAKLEARGQLEQEAMLKAITAHEQATEKAKDPQTALDFEAGATAAAAQ
jgi:hypothetical protein